MKETGISSENHGRRWLMGFIIRGKKVGALENKEFFLLYCGCGIVFSLFCE